MKIAMLGESGVGKTCIVERYVNDKYNEYSEPSKGASFLTKSLRSVGGRMDIKLFIWDTAGQEVFRSIAPLYYKDADALIVVFDTTQEKSFDALTFWLEEIKQQAAATATIVIAGNKSDLIEQQQVLPERARDFATKQNAKFFLTSAKANSNISPMFLEIVRARFPDFVLSETPDSGGLDVPDALLSRKATEAFRINAETRKVLLADERKRQKNCGC